MFKKILKKCASLLDPDFKDEGWSQSAEQQYHAAMMIFGALLIGMVTSVSLMLVFAFLNKNVPPPQIFLVKNGAVIGKAPLLKIPPVTLERVSLWASAAVRDIYTVNFINVTEKTNLSYHYFTNSGKFAFSLDQKNMIERISNEKIMDYAIPNSKPRILDAHVNFMGEKVWKVEIDVLLRTVTSSNNESGKKDGIMTKKVVQLDIIQVNPEESIDGLAIDTLKMFSAEK